MCHSTVAPWAVPFALVLGRFVTMFDDVLRVVRARWFLRSASQLGPRVRLRGRPRIAVKGDLVIGDRVQFESAVARLEIGVGPGARMEIGERTLVNYGCSIVALDRVTIGERCLIGTHCLVMDTPFHGVDPDRRLDPDPPEPVTIGDNVWLGARVVVTPGVTIGDDSVIGIGSIVTKDIPPRSLAVGAPAEVVRTL